MKRTSFTRPLVALAMTVAFVAGQVTWALAGTTGGIAGYVRESNGAPVVGASVLAAAPSGTASATTDAQGHFNFLALAPDTYTISVRKQNYADANLPGVVVFADQTNTINIAEDKALSTIAKVTAHATSTSLVKSGVTTDTYSVDSAGAAKAAALGGGGNLQNTYSAIASVPGVVVGTQAMGWNQNVYIRGSQGFFAGYEYDGVPVNRAFDNYNSSTESSLGLQELQVYTGGGPAGNSSSGTSGFINQVIKSGTYPGFAQLEGGIASDAFYHQAKLEVGGSTPDRNFSYYAGFGGYDQSYRYYDQQNGASLTTPGAIFDDYLGFSVFGSNPITTGAGNLIADANVCGQNASGNPIPGPGEANISPNANPSNAGATPFSNDPGCYYNALGLTDSTSRISDREDVINFHFGIPRKNGQRDDLQLLWSASSLKTDFYGSPDDIGLNNYMNIIDGEGYSAPGSSAKNAFGVPGGNYPFYIDAFTYNLPFGSNLGSGATSLAPTPYFQPSSPSNREGTVFGTATGGGYTSPFPLNQEDGFFNDTGILKAQYTHPLSDHAYVRAFGYTFFSDWTQQGLNSAQTEEELETSALPNYDLITHTTGGEIQLADQVNDKNLLNLTGNYTQANVDRFNNSGFLGGYEPVGLISRSASGQYTCYDNTPGAGGSVIPCYEGAADSSSEASPAAGGAGYMPVTGPAGCNLGASPTCIGPGPAATNGAYYANLWNGNSQGTYNTVKPKFSFLSLTDQFRPSDKWLLSGGMRFEQFKYDLPSTDNPQNDYYAQIVQNYTCFDPATNTVAVSPLTPGEPPPANPILTNGSCATAVGPGYVHPNGAVQGGITAPTFTASSPDEYALNYWSARFSGTYSESPDTVWRFEGGRFTEPPISASLQYVKNSGDATSLWSNFLNLGFLSPFHAIPAQSAAQYDFSLERHIRGTDLSFKLSPFYNFTTGYQQQSFIGAGFVTQVPVGNFRSMGVEAALTKGDFNRNGLSGQLSLTYTKAQVQYESTFGGALPNNVVTLNQYISSYNKLTKAGGGAKCYTATLPATSTTATVPGSADSSCANATDILNPYYNLPEQGLLNPSGWYAASGQQLAAGVNTAPAFYDTPWVAALVLNYRKDRIAVTPSLQINQGSSYGSPLDFVGPDPRLCAQNSAQAGITAVSPNTNPLQCNYITEQGQGAQPLGILYVPDSQTGSFTSLGQYRNPWEMVGNMAITYDVTPKLSAQITLTNIFHTCFGGTKAPWTAAYAPGTNICGYTGNSLYVGPSAGAPYGWYNGTSPYDGKANGATPYLFQTQSYAPLSNNGAGSNTPLPFNAYLQLTLKL